MTFTEEDAQDDGKIKRQAGERLHSKLASNSGVLYSLFEEYCDKNGLEPSRVIGDMLLRALKDEGYAGRVQQTVVEPQRLQTEQVRKEDLELVTELIDEYSDDEGGQGSDPVMAMLERRLEAVGSGPLSGITGNGKEGGSGNSSEIEQRLDRLESMIQDMSQGGTGGSAESSAGGPAPQEDGGPPSPEEENIDELFNDVESSDSPTDSGEVDPDVDSPNEEAHFSYEVGDDGPADPAEEPAEDSRDGTEESDVDGDSDLDFDPESESELIGDDESGSGPTEESDEGQSVDGSDDENHPTFSTDRAEGDNGDS